VSPVTRHREQARFRQLPEMSTRGLRSDPRRHGKLGRGQRAAVEERRDDRGPRRVADEGRDLGDDGAGDHVAI